MLEFTVMAILGLMLLMFRKMNSSPPPEQPFYFSEEEELPSVWAGGSGELDFYTIAEFKETQTISASGIQKHLGFWTSR